jgi:predicted nucleotidyltransferase
MLDVRSKSRQALLSYYFVNPDARHHLRELAALLGVDPSNLSKDLRRLEEEGLFTSQMEGRQKYFSLDRSYALFEEVRSIVEKTIGVVPLLSATLITIKGVEEAWLYGSFAREQQNSGSDIDVLVLGKPNSHTLAEKMGALELRLGREINYTVMGPDEFKARRARKDAFLEDVWRNKRVPLAVRN